MVDRSSSFIDKEAQCEERAGEEGSSPFAVSATGLSDLNEVCSRVFGCIDTGGRHMYSVMVRVSSRGVFDYYCAACVGQR